jgi:hypothetical protein
MEAIFQNYSHGKQYDLNQFVVVLYRYPHRSLSNKEHAMVRCPIELFQNTPVALSQLARFLLFNPVCGRRRESG